MDIKPEALAKATIVGYAISYILTRLNKLSIPITAVTTARLDSWGVLLLYQVATSTDGADACHAYPVMSSS